MFCADNASTQVAYFQSEACDRSQTLVHCKLDIHRKSHMMGFVIDGHSLSFNREVTWFVNGPITWSQMWKSNIGLSRWQNLHHQWEPAFMQFEPATVIGDHDQTLIMFQLSSCQHLCYTVLSSSFEFVAMVVSACKCLCVHVRPHQLDYMFLGQNLPKNRPGRSITTHKYKRIYDTSNVIM